MRRQHTSEPTGVSMTRVPLRGRSKVVATMSVRNWQSGSDVTNVSTRARSYTKLLKVSRPGPGGGESIGGGAGGSHRNTEFSALTTGANGSPGGGGAVQETTPKSTTRMSILRMAHSPPRKS